MKQDNDWTLSWLFWAAAVTFCLIIYTYFIGGFRLFTHDTVALNYSLREFISNSIRSGIFPLWDSFNSPGFPFTFLSGGSNYYLLGFVTGIMRPYDQYSFMIEIVTGHLIGLAGMYFWLRFCGARKALAIAGAIGFAGCGPFVTSIQSYPVQSTMIYIPWFFLGLHLIVRSPIQCVRMRLLGIAHVAWSSWMMVSGGYVAVFLPVMFFGAIHSICHGWRYPKRFFAAGISGLAAVVLVCLLLFLPLTEFWNIMWPHMNALRGIGSGFDPYMDALPPVSLLTLVLGNGAGYLPGVITGRAEQMYVGLFLGLAVPCSIFSFGLKRREWISLVIGLIAAFAAMGSWSPIARLLVENVPGFGWLRHHCFWAIIPVFLWITVAVSAIGRLLHLTEGPERENVLRKFIFSMFGVLAVVMVVSVYLGRTSHNLVSPVITRFDMIGYVLFGLFFGFASFMWFVISRRCGNAEQLSKAFRCFICFLFVMVIGFVVAGRYLPGNIVAYLAGLFADDFKLPPAVSGLSALARIMDQHQFGILPRWMFLMDVIHAGWILSACVFILWNWRKGVPWMSISIVVVVLCDLGFASIRYTQGNPCWVGQEVIRIPREICCTVNHRMPSNADASPYQDGKVYLSTMLPLNNPNLVALGRDEATAPVVSRLAWYFPEKVPPDLKDWSELDDGSAIRSVKLWPNKFQVSVSADKPGYVIWVDMWAPGWNVQVDGVDSKVEKIHDLMKGVRVPVGRHVIEFFYRPVWLKVGILSFIVGLTLLITLLIVGLSNPRQSTRMGKPRLVE